jgi:hypothetical protein
MERASIIRRFPHAKRSDINAKKRRTIFPNVENKHALSCQSFLHIIEAFREEIYLVFQIPVSLHVVLHKLH